MSDRRPEVGEEEPPAGTQDAKDLAQGRELRSRRQVVEREGADGDVDGFGRQGKRFRASRIECDPAAPPPKTAGGDREHTWVRINARGEKSSVPTEGFREQPSGAAADVEEAQGIAERKARGDVPPKAPTEPQDFAPQIVERGEPVPARGRHDLVVGSGRSQESP